MAFAIILLLGPGDQEIERAQDLFDSILCHEGERAGEADVYLVNDGNTNVQALDGFLKRFGHCYHLQNPLVALGRPHLLNKHTAGMLHGLSEIARRGPYRFALKLDTDALIINPFHDKLARFFEENPRAGMAGSYLSLPHGVQRRGHLTWTPLIEKAAHIGSVRETVQKDPLRAPAALFRILKRRRILNKALRQNYVHGHHVQGGSYAVSGALLLRWAECSLQDLRMLFRDVAIGEDVIVSLLAMWAGYELRDFNSPGEVFGVWWLKLRIAPEVLLQHYSVIHSVKSYEGQDEQELRKLFKARRDAVAGAAGLA